MSTVVVVLGFQFTVIFLNILCMFQLIALHSFHLLFITIRFRLTCLTGSYSGAEIDGVDMWDAILNDEVSPRVEIVHYVNRDGYGSIQVNMLIIVYFYLNSAMFFRGLPPKVSKGIID